VLSSCLKFDPANPPWTEIPAQAGIFALFGADPRAEPYLSRTPNLRRRLRRLLDPRPEQSKRLRLAESVVRIEYTLTGSDFEAWLLLYDASLAVFGERARKRLHLRPPVFLRMAMENAYPRVYVTNRITKSAAGNLFGPFPSRNAAESFLESMLNLFELRRCTDDLHPDPNFPGCVYSEMKKCMAPCFKGCTDERYAQEAAAVHAFLATRGESMIAKLSQERDAASAELDFERAAEIHARLAKVETAVAGLAPAVRPLAELNAVVVQPSGEANGEAEEVKLFLLNAGCLAGPVPYSVAGMRHQNEHSGSSSLFAQPVAVEAVPLDEGGAPAVKLATRDTLEARLEEALAKLRMQTAQIRGGAQQTADHLGLFTRWYYRPQTRRIGEACFSEANGEIPKRPLLRSISRVYRQGLTGATAEPADSPS
jgi:excinuclease UvrABC nuclease subunit